MTPVSLARIDKSTTGRLLSTGMRVLDAVAPSAAQRFAFDLFGMPRRRRDQPTVPGDRFSIAGDGPELAVWDWGDGQTVLLVHGWNGNGAQLSAFVPPLLRAGYYVAAPDLPAHGDSAGARSNVLEMADAILRVGRRVGPVHAVIAHSLGAAATLIALAEGLGARRAVLIAAPADLPRYLRGFAQAIGLSKGSTARLESRVGGMLAERKALDLLGLARGQKARVLLMHDPTDREVPFEDARALAGAWPGASLLPVSRAGHPRALRHPEVIQRAVAFVSEPPRLVALSGPTLAFVARRKSAGARRSLGAADARGHGDDLEQLDGLVGEGRKRFARAEHSAHEGGQHESTEQRLSDPNPRLFGLWL